MNIWRKNCFYKQNQCRMNPFIEIMESPNPCISLECLELNNKLLIDWREYLFWLRSVIINIIYDVPELNATINRFLMTSKIISSTFIKYYGEEVGTKFEIIFNKLLMNNIDYIMALIKNDQEELQEQKRKEYVREISEFLESINRYWNSEKLINEQQQLMEGIVEVTNLILEGKYDESIEMFDRITTQQLGLVSMIYKGLINQFHI